jgi:hypothetical protein
VRSNSKRARPSTRSISVREPVRVSTLKITESGSSPQSQQVKSTSAMPGSASRTSATYDQPVSLRLPRRLPLSGM